MDLRAFIDLLSTQGHLKRIEREVDCKGISWTPRFHEWSEQYWVDRTRPGSPYARPEGNNQGSQNKTAEPAGAHDRGVRPRSGEYGCGV